MNRLRYFSLSIPMNKFMGYPVLSDSPNAYPFTAAHEFISRNSKGFEEMQNKINPQFQLWDLKEKQERNRFNGFPPKNFEGRKV